jgi:hypothetical protein
MDRERGTSDLNAVGPGIYLTRSRQQALGYAYPSGWLYKLTIRPGARILNEQEPPRRAIISQMIDLAPAESREIGLSNYAENPVYARVEAEASYVHANTTLLDALVFLYHDFYGYDANDWTAAMVKVGFDATLHRLPEVDHLIVYNPQIIEQIDETPYRSKGAPRTKKP